MRSTRMLSATMKKPPQNAIAMPTANRRAMRSRKRNHAAMLTKNGVRLVTKVELATVVSLSDQCQMERSAANRRPAMAALRMGEPARDGPDECCSSDSRFHKSQTIG